MNRLLPFVLLLAGCPEGELVCTQIAAASSLIHVVDEDGSPLVATITAVDAEGNTVEAMCAGIADASACTDWVVGYEIEGEIVISASASDECGNTGNGSVTVDVPLDAEGCHVVQQEATLSVSEWTDLACE